ncbi:MAG TPA: hypothetical protein VNP73_04345 [Actinomycetota bacterium]|nr:hypothetical protein [Actinomycetota bacterium]
MSDPNNPLGPQGTSSRWDGNAKALFVMHILVSVLLASRLGNLWSAYGFGLFIGCFVPPLVIALVLRWIYVAARSGRQPIWGTALLGMALFIDALLLLGFQAS